MRRKKFVAPHVSVYTPRHRGVFLARENHQTRGRVVNYLVLLLGFGVAHFDTENSVTSHFLVGIIPTTCVGRFLHNPFE